MTRRGVRDEGSVQLHIHGDSNASTACWSPAIRITPDSQFLDAQEVCLVKSRLLVVSFKSMPDSRLVRHLALDAAFWYFLPSAFLVVYVGALRQPPSAVLPHLWAMALLFAVPVLGERLDAMTVLFSLAVIATVFIGKKMPVNTTKSGAQPT